MAKDKPNEDISILEEKLRDFRRAYAILAEGPKRFELKKSIELAEKELEEAKAREEKEKAPKITVDSQFGLSAKYHPYACDRVDQRDLFIKKNEITKSKPVHFFYLHGEAPQSHRGMFQRLHYEIKGIDPKQQNLKPSDYPRFAEVRDSNDEVIYKKEILTSLFRYFSLDINDYAHMELDDFHLKLICRDSPDLRGFSSEDYTTVMFHVVSYTWKPFTKNLIRWFIEKFCEPSQIPAGSPTFYFFLAVVYDSSTQKYRRWWNLFGKKSDDPRGRLKAIAEEHRQVVLLPELDKVSQEDIKTWFTNFNLSIPASQKRQIFAEYFEKAGLYDMEIVIEGLEKAVNLHNENLPNE